jgi:hypothetical protein
LPDPGEFSKTFTAGAIRQGEEDEVLRNTRILAAGRKREVWRCGWDSGHGLAPGKGAGVPLAETPLGVEQNLWRAERLREVTDGGENLRMWAFVSFSEKPPRTLEVSRKRPSSGAAPEQDVVLAEEDADGLRGMAHRLRHIPQRREEAEEGKNAERALHSVQERGSEN